MTDAEKMLETMMMMGKAASGEQQTQLDTAAKSLRMMYDSYIHAGFSPKMAFELTKEILHSCIVGGLKK